MLFPPAQSSIWLRGQAAKANSFAQVRSPKRTTKRKVTGTMRLSIDSLQHLQVYFQVFVPVLVVPAVVCFAAQTARLAPTIVQDPGLPIWCRSRRSRGAKKDYEEMLAKK